MTTKKTVRSGKLTGDSKKDLIPQEPSASFTPSGIKVFLAEVQAEFRKIVWPAKKATAGLTGFVILLVIVISLYLGSVDLALGWLVAFVLK